MLELFLSSFIALLVIADPLGTAAVFHSLTKRQDRADRRRIAMQASIIAALLLIAFALAGMALLKALGISLDAFRIAGGLLLFVTAFRMIMGGHDEDQLSSETAVYRDQTNVAVFPLAIPLLSGPGCMTVVILNMSAAHSQFEGTAVLWAGGLVIAAILAVQALAWLSMVFISRITELTGRMGSDIISRVVGVLLAALAVQFIINGLVAVFPFMGTA
ncbi:MAG: MarC family protein [Alphaproteobacteria bacterium]